MSIQGQTVGASFKKLFEATKLCTVPAVAQLKLLNWSMFNLIIGKPDAHGKNFSFFKVLKY